MEDQTNPAFPVDGDADAIEPLADTGATAEVDAEQDSAEEDIDSTLDNGMDSGSGDPNDDRAFLMDQAPADLTGADPGAAQSAGASDADGPDEDDAEAWGAQDADADMLSPGEKDQLNE